MNRIEALKAEKDGLDVLDDLVRFAREGWKTIADDDKERLKWAGVFHRRPTPGHFMMRVRMPNGIVTAAQVRAPRRDHEGVGHGTLPTSPRASRCSCAGSTIEERARGDRAPRGGRPHDPADGDGQHPRHRRLPGRRADAAASCSTRPGSRASSSGSSSATRSSPTCRASSTSRSPAASRTARRGETQDIVAGARASRAWRRASRRLQRGRRRQAGLGRYPSSPRRSTSSCGPGRRPRSAAAIALIFRDHGPREARSSGAARLPDRRVGSGAVPQGARGAPGPAAARRRARARGETTNDHIGVFRQQQPGLNYVGLKTPVGRVSGDQLLELARLVRVVRPRRAALHALAERAHSARPRRAGRRPDAGAAAQGAALQPARGRARARRVHGHGLLQPGPDRHEDARDGARPRALAESGGMRPLTIRWSGCPASCGNHHTADIGLQGCKVKVERQDRRRRPRVRGRPRRPRSPRGHADPRGPAVRRAAGGAGAARPFFPRPARAAGARSERVRLSGGARSHRALVSRRRRRDDRRA